MRFSRKERKGRIRSFMYAISGIAATVKSERNMRIHLAAAVTVVVLGAWLGLDGRYSIKTTIREQLAKIAAVLDVILRRSPKFLGPREKLPPPVEEGDVPNPPENREPTPRTVAVNPSVYNVLQILQEF